MRRKTKIVLLRILSTLGRYSVGTTYRRGGFGYLRKTISGWNNAAKGRPFIVLTDLDRYVCPNALIEDWLGRPPHPNLLFRIAVHEVEAWLLADRLNISRFLQVSEKFVPLNADDLVDPKGTLVSVARRSRSGSIRGRLAPKRGSTAKQGQDYNGCLGEFVRTSWNVGAAASGSASLRRTIDRLVKFEPLWT